MATDFDMTLRGGFTLIEMLVVLVVVSVLALIALPSYQDQIVRKQIADALPLADIAKPPVAFAWATGLPLPPNNADAGLPVPEKIVSAFISSVTMQDGAIHITFGNSANGIIKGKILSLRPAVVADTPIVPITWVCGYKTAPEKMTLKGENKTNIPMGFLPFACRTA